MIHVYSTSSVTRKEESSCQIGGTQLFIWSRVLVRMLLVYLLQCCSLQLPGEKPNVFAINYYIQYDQTRIPSISQPASTPRFQALESLVTRTVFVRLAFFVAGDQPQRRATRSHSGSRICSCRTTRYPSLDQHLAREILKAYPFSR